MNVPPPSHYPSIGASPQTPMGDAVVMGVGESVPVNFRDLPWTDRVAHVVETMREVSSESDPQAMVRAYSKRLRGSLVPGHVISLSQRGLSAPRVRITRSTLWEESVDPWAHPERLPIVEGGLFAELIYGDDFRIINDLREHTFTPGDPAAEYLKHAGSLVAIPHFENGRGLNMVVHTAFEPFAFEHERLPDFVLQSNLFGRGTKNLVLARDLNRAMDQLDAELRSVQEIQLSLLPRAMPEIAGLDIASHYQTAKRAGGDYFDFFELPDGWWGVLVADVSGHGTPAAVLMAIVHAIAHQLPVHERDPASVLAGVNTTLARLYTRDTGAFVTMWYGVLHPQTGEMRFANAGHPVPLLRDRDGTVRELATPHAGLPLGILADATYETMIARLERGQGMVVYSDGITEAFGPGRELFGEERLKRAIARGHAVINAASSEACARGCAHGIVDAITEDVGLFAGLDSRSDDRTVVVVSRE